MTPDGCWHCSDLRRQLRGSINAAARAESSGRTVAIHLADVERRKAEIRECIASGHAWHAQGPKRVRGATHATGDPSRNETPTLTGEERE